MYEKTPWTLRNIIFASLAVAFVLFVHGAIPFLMLPTLGQAVWTTGFSQSLANGPLFDFYAHDFGIPKPAAIAFGLAGAWPASLLIRLGLHPADAYAGMVALWLGLAMFSAYQIARRFGAERSIALLGVVMWMSMPIIWAHAGYSMLSLGIALLSFYYLAAFRLFLVESETTRIPPTAIALYFVAAIVSVFMDGYTFMMFATGSSILLLYSLITRPEIRSALIKISIPTQVASFALAYVLFSIYIGKSNFEAHQLDFFRGWGLDLSFIAIPTKGVLWLPDLLGLSIERSNQKYFGDASVWTTTFAFPLILAALVAWWSVGRKVDIGAGFLMLAGFAFYMALGPSLKILSTKPVSLQVASPRALSQGMSAEHAVIPTGNAWLSENVPGFNVMRASYRWSALGVFAFWLIIIVWASKSECRKKNAPWILTIIIAVNLPEPSGWWRTSNGERALFFEIDKQLVGELGNLIGKGEVAAFVPWDNDYIVSYLAPRTGFRTFNIGGDKNLREAQTKWPNDFLILSGGGAIKAEYVVKLLVDGGVDVVLVPYLQQLFQATPEYRPCLDITTSHSYNEKRRVTGFVCPSQWSLITQPNFDMLKETSFLEVTELKYFSSVRLRPQFYGEANRSVLFNSIFEGIQYPIELRADSKVCPYVLREGWHALEAHHVWSQAAAKVMLPVPKECGAKECYAVLKFAVFGPSPQRPVTILFDSADQGWLWAEKIVASSGDSIQVKVPLTGQKISSREIAISVPDATSPLALSGSPDARVLGIALQRIELIEGSRQ